MENIKIIEFLLEAKRNTYAASQGKMDSSRPNSYDLSFEKGRLKYIDSYLGTHLFTGEEAIWEDECPIWAMNYSGRVLDEANFSSRFLKEALMHPNEEYPYRGLPLFKQGEYTYLMEVQGDFSWFTGRELIFKHSLLVYELNFHGGKVLDKHFD